MARRQVDDQSPDLAFPHRGQLGGDDLEMPVVSERRLRIELGKAALREKPEIRPKHRIVFGRRKAVHRRTFPFSDRNRSRMREMISWSASVRAVCSAEPSA